MTFLIITVSSFMGLFSKFSVIRKNWLESPIVVMDDCWEILGSFVVDDIESIASITNN